MRTSPNYAPVDEATSTIPLTSSKTFLFYEPLILLLALIEEMRSTASYISPSEVCDSSDPEQLFKAFLNKLALVCGSSKGPETITAIWVSEDAPGQVEYHIASNQLKSHELDALGSFVKTLLVEAVAFFLRAKATWPRLFSSFTVTPIPSSRRMPKMDIRRKSLTAESIVGRMTRRKNDMKLFRGFVESLQLFQLDDRIHEAFTKDSLRPVVHAEVLLLNHIEFSGGITPDRFFGGWPYIGSSKPTCRLCHYYFVEHGSGVGHRASHGNLYVNWRFPDVREADGAAALQARTNMMSKILARVRRDAFDLVRRRAVPTYRGHDSATTSARVTLEERWSTTSRADDLASMMGDLGLEDEDEDGGARL